MKKKNNKVEQNRDAMRRKILDAARNVYVKYSYDAGSVRMIAREAGVAFGLIRYYFPNKAELFRAVMRGACEELIKVHESSMVGMEKLRPEEGFPIYIDRYFGHFCDHPASLKIIMNNIYWPQDPDVEIPGYEFLPYAFSENRKSVNKVLKLNGRKQEELIRFSDSLNAHLFMFIGADSCQAGLLGLEPDSKKYLQWVKETMSYLYLPRLKQILS